MAAFLLAEMVLVATAVAERGAKALPSAPVGASNAEQIGRVLYTDYIYFFQAAGMVLLVAMIGAIVLTLRHKPGVKRQDLAAQAQRTPAAGLRLTRPATGQGIAE